MLASFRWTLQRFSFAHGVASSGPLSLLIVVGASFLAVSLLAVSLLAGALPAAPGEKQAVEKKDAANKESKSKTDDEETEAQQAARKIVDAIKLTSVAREERYALELVKQPVLRFGDIPRDNDKGSVWIWRHAGRPQAIMELYRATETGAWVHVMHSLAAEALDGDFGNPTPRWTPPSPGIQWHDLAGAPVPAERSASRARQIKELAQRYTGHEFWDPNNSRFELRLLVQPAYKYSEAEGGLLDGAVFLLCHETNPEVALLIEAITESGNAKFRYALARLGHAELHVEIDEKEVWRQERLAETSPRDSYWLLYRSSNP